MNRGSASYVSRRPGICGGLPIVTGSRTPVWMLAEAYLRSRGSVNSVCRRFPQRSRAEVLAALLYFEEHRREIAAQIRHATHERRRVAATTAAWLKRRRGRRAA
ncbi:MAG: DUF433 domain-containing protein [Deltaproteobacteria bacterium]|nr:DUF433 domain-containing protein [Deltaproteobacteria bacterium]